MHCTIEKFSVPRLYSRPLKGRIPAHTVPATPKHRDRLRDARIARPNKEISHRSQCRREQEVRSSTLACLQEGLTTVDDQPESSWNDSGYRTRLQLVIHGPHYQYTNWGCEVTNVILRAIWRNEIGAMLANIFVDSLLCCSDQHESVSE